MLSNTPNTVGILYFGGTAGDLQDTIEAVAGIEKALIDKGYEVNKIQVNESNWESAAYIEGDVVINLVEDPGFVLYMKVGKALEQLERAQMGYDKKYFKYICDKAYFKRKMRLGKIPTPRNRILINSKRINSCRDLKFPLIVKPACEHAGVGIDQNSVVMNMKELINKVRELEVSLPGEIIAEEYIDGREMHVTVMGNGKNILALPICEILFGGNFEENWKVYSYKAKWEKGCWEYEAARVDAPAKISKKLTKEITELAIKVYKNLECRDIARMDLRVDKSNHPYVIDININPSLNRYDEQDATLKSLEAAGWTYEDFIDQLMRIVYHRFNEKKNIEITSRQSILSTI